MSTELTTHTAASDLASQMEFARAVTTGGRAGSILPDAYRENPANVLIAVGLGQAMGLSPAESLYRISVIKGKPAAGAELIAANVRKAGHKLRVRGDETSATATIVRADDPDFEFTVTRDLEWAKRMGLASNDNYKKQPGTMLQWRAITAVARMACPEALYGVQYTVDEAWDIPAERQGDQPAPVKVSAADFTAPAKSAPSPAEPAEDKPSQAMTRKMFATLREVGVGDRASGLAYIGDVVGREVSSSKELSRDEVSRVIESAEAELAAQNGTAAESAPEDVTRYDNDQTLDGWPEAAVPGGAA